MGLVYVFALIVAAGVLVVQVVAGGRGGHHGDVGHALGAGHAGGHAHASHADAEPALWTLLLSLRFWTFASLGFGLSGTLLHHLGLAESAVTLGVATGAGVASGLFAVLAFRALRRGSSTTEARSSLAVGKIARVVVPCGPGVTGQVRIELAGSSVDLMAIADDAVSRGESVLIEDLHEGVARVSRRPAELV